MNFAGERDCFMPIDQTIDTSLCLSSNEINYKSRIYSHVKENLFNALSNSAQNLNNEILQEEELQKHNYLTQEMMRFSTYKSALRSNSIPVPRVELFTKDYGKTFQY